MNDQDTPSKRRRREHSPMFKREVVARSLAPGASVAAVALEAGINSNLLFAWRRMHRDVQAQNLPPTPSGSPVLLPVTIEAAPVAACPEPAALRQTSGTIEIDVGGARVRLRGTVDEASVRYVLQTLNALR
nr:IS66 family transposition protein [uncultured bacterium]